MCSEEYPPLTGHSYEGLGWRGSRKLYLLYSVDVKLANGLETKNASIRKQTMLIRRY